MCNKQKNTGEIVYKKDGSIDYEQMQINALKRLKQRADFPRGSVHHPDGVWG